ncbi:hematopoietic cell signal transducer [Emydura macquarii macquarii]|uniref:hematopoietic cell signal transducer n=1 Tax=Emydura macquarii macquarii TaxID=1129001 RepID=UPI00352B3A42
MGGPALAFLCLLIADAASAQGQGPCGDCYQIGTPVIVGMVAGDLAFTLLLIIGVYHCTKRCSKPPGNGEDQKVYMNMPGRVN